MLTKVARATAVRLSPRRRSQVHLLLDRALRPIGSIQRGKRPTRLVALTFDDGPDPACTPPILDVLAARAVRATFFLLVDEAVKSPDLVHRMIAEGHEIGLHSDRHDRLTKLSFRKVLTRLATARAQLEELIEAPVRLFRPPFGSQSTRTFLAARAAGLTPVVWNVTPRDWLEQTAEQAANNLLSVVKGGDIALLHDGLAVPDGEPHPTFYRAEMLDLIIAGLQKRDLDSTSVSGLVADAGAKFTAWFRE